MNLPEGWKIADINQISRLHGDHGYELDYSVCFSEKTDFSNEVPEDFKKTSQPGDIYKNQNTGNNLQQGNDGLWRRVKDKAKRGIAKIKNKIRRPKEEQSQREEENQSTNSPQEQQQQEQEDDYEDDEETGLDQETIKKRRLDRFNRALTKEAEAKGFEFNPGGLSSEYSFFTMKKEVDGIPVDFSIAPNFSTMMFSVGGSYKRDENIDKRTKVKMALAVKNMFETAKKNMKLKPGHVIFVQAYGDDGPENQQVRIKAYQAFGFGPPDKNGVMKTEIGENMSFNPVEPKRSAWDDFLDEEIPEEQDEEFTWDDDYAENNDGIPLDVFYGILFNSRMR